MKTRLIHEDGEKTFAVVFDTGDEVIAGLRAFAEKNHLRASHFTAIGACSDVTLGFFDLNKKDYRKIPIKEQVEVVALTGDVTLDETGIPQVHAHVVVSKADVQRMVGT
jgi:predicted DNA-binding protein with PD1-like motif